MNVALDTNILCQDFNLDGTQFRVFLSGLDLVPAKLFVPQVVIDETVTKFAEALTEQARAHERCSHDVNRLLPKSKRVPRLELDINAERESYRVRLLKALETHGAKIVPYPKTPHEEVVARELQRKRPFRKDGGGYRDFLIWESVRHLILEGPERAAFITNNTRDFGEGPEPHPELARDVLNPSQFKIIRSLTAFNDEFIVPRLKTIDDAKKKLQEANLNGFDLRQWLRSGLVDLLRNYEVEDTLAGVEHHMARTWVKEVSRYSNIVVEEARALENGRTFVKVLVDLEAEYSIDVDWEDYVRYSEVRDLVGSTEPFSFCSWAQSAELRVRVSLILTSGGKVEDQELMEINGPYGRVEFVI